MLDKSFSMKEGKLEAVKFHASKIVQRYYNKGKQ